MLLFLKIIETAGDRNKQGENKIILGAGGVHHVESYFPDEGLNLYPLRWKHRGLTTGPPGKSLSKTVLDEAINSVRLECGAGKALQRTGVE